MKHFQYVLLVALVGFLVPLSPVQARNIDIGLSPYLGQKEAKRQVQLVIHYLANNLSLGDTSKVFDAYNNKNLGTFKVPNKSSYRHPKAKIGANKALIGALIQFGKDSKALGGSGAPSVNGAIKLPQFLRFVGTNFPAKSPTDLIILGSPLYDSPSEKNFSMAQGHVPSDAYIAKSRVDSPFGAEGNQNLLDNFRVHFGFPDDEWKQNDQHSHYVKRFTTLFIESQGGKLVTFTHDLNTLFQRVQDKALAPKHDFVLEPSEKLEMNLFHYKEVKREQVSIFERPISSIPVSIGTAHNAEWVSVGLSWSCQCDIDIYALPEFSSKPLYFGNKTSEFSGGIFHKDFLSSPRLSHAFETITFHKAINLKTLFLAANFFSGQVSEFVQLELRIAIGDKTYMKRFLLQASEGNKGLGRNKTINSRQPANANWVVINPLQVVGLDNAS